MKSKIVVGGQMEKQNIKNLIEELGEGKVTAEVKSDLAPPMMSKWAKQTIMSALVTPGAVGLEHGLSPLLTRDKCVSLSMPGRPPQEEEIVQAVKAGKVAFGFYR